ncbi:MAG: isoamylase early set domain-containing protein [Chloroflexota bacterium]
MLKKQAVKTRNVVKVTFAIQKEELPEGIVVETLNLVGEFNDWDETADPLTYRKKDKAYRITLELEPGHEYQFRYLINGQHWCNDWKADQYTPNEFGADNCVVVTPEIG